MFLILPFISTVLLRVDESHSPEYFSLEIAMNQWQFIPDLWPIVWLFVASAPVSAGEYQYDGSEAGGNRWGITKTM